MSKRIVNFSNIFVKYIILAAWTIVTIYPLIFILNTSLKNQFEFFNDLFGFPARAMVENYIKVFVVSKLHINMLNSLIVTVFAVLLQLLLGSMASFILSRFTFKYRNRILLLFMGGVLIPIQGILIPIALIAKYVNGYNNFAFLIAVYTATGLPYVIFIITGFMKGIPKGVEEAALIDGSSVNMLFTNIVLPLSIPALSTMGILAFFGSWNELIFSVILLKSNSLMTISVGLTKFVGDRYTDYPLQCAAVIVSMIPTLLIYFLLQEKVIKGITAGAVKG